MSAFRPFALGTVLLGLLLVGTTPGRAGQNDAFAGRLAIDATSAVVVGDVGAATRETDEPAHAHTAGLRSVWWSWTPSADHQAQLSLIGADEEAVALAVYTGETLADLIPVATAQNASDGAGPAALAFAARAGTTYAICASLAADIPAERVALSLNRPPLFNIAAEHRVAVGASVSLSLAALHAPTLYSVAGLPPGLVLDPVTAKLSGVPLAPGEHWLDLVAENAFGRGAARIRLEIVPPPAPASDAPRFTLPRTIHGVVGQNLRATASVTSVGQATFSATGLPAGIALHPGTGEVIGAPSATGVFEAVVTASNTQGESAAPVTFVIADSAGAPVLRGRAASELVLGDTLSLALDPSDTGATLVAGPLPEGVSLDTVQRRLVGVPTAVGRHEMEITATNAAGSSTAIFTLLVHAAAVRPPEFTHSGIWMTELGAASTFALTAAQGPATFFVEDLPDWASFDAASAMLHAHPVTLGVFPLRVTATNARGSSRGVVNLYVGTAAVSNQLLPVLRGSGFPSLPVPLSIAGTVGSAFSYTIPINSDILYISPLSPAPALAVEGLPAELAFDPQTWRIAGTVTSAGDHPVLIRYFNNGDMIETMTTLSFRPAAPASPAPATPEPASLIVAPLTLSARTGSSASLAVATPSSTATFSVTGLPAGLSFSPSTGRITGTTTTAGTFPLDISAANSSGQASARCVLQVGRAPRPVFSSAPVAASATVGLDYWEWFYASNSPTSYACLGTLPPGLTFDTSSGDLEGTPTVAGTYPLTILATNSAGSDQILFTLVVRPAEPAEIRFPAQLVLTQGVPATRSATSYPSGPTYSVSGLPPGLTMTNAGVLSGTPTTAGDFAVTLLAMNNGTFSQLKSRIQVLPANAASTLPVFTSAAGASAVLGAPFSFALSASNSPSAYTAAPLPPGLSLDPATGLITGTPAETGDFDIVCGASNSQGTTDARLALRVLAAPSTPPILALPSLARLTLGDASARLDLKPSNLPQSVTATGLPPGLAIDPEGVISGVPRRPGVFPVTVTATNAAGATTVTFDLSIRTASNAPTIAINSTLNGRVGRPFNQSVLPTSGTFEEIAVAGLPAGLGFDPVQRSIVGTPASPGISDLDIFIRTGSAGAYARVRLTVSAAQPGRPLFTSPASVSATVGQPFTHRLAATDGVTAYTSVATLPAWLTLDSSTGVLSGTPTSAGDISFLVRATNTRGARDARLNIAVRHSIQPPPPLPLNTPGSLVARKGELFSHPLTFSNGGSLSYVSGFPGAVSYTAPPSLVYLPSYTASSGTSTVTINSYGTGGSHADYVLFEVEDQPTPTLGLQAPAAIRGQANFYLYQSLSTTFGSAVFAATDLPPGLSLSSSGTLSGYPSVGDYLATITASSATGTATGFIQFAITASTSSTPAVATPTTYDLVAGAYVSLSPALPALSSATYQAEGLPAGLYFDPGRRLIQGTPAAAGAYAAKFSAVPSSSYYPGYPSLPDPVTAILFVRAAPVAPSAFTSPAEYRGTVGIDFSQTLSATHGPTRFTATGLPPGLVLIASSGVITGRPTAAGEYLVAANASNPAGSAPALIRIVVVDDTPPPVIGGDLHAVMKAGEFSSHLLGVQNSPVTISATGLPPGLTLGASGSITGTPTTPGVYSATISAGNRGGTSVANVLFHVLQPDLADLFWPATDSSFDAGANISELLLSGDLSGISINATGLPAGLHLDPLSSGSRYLEGRLDSPGNHAVGFELSGHGQTLSVPALFKATAPAAPTISSAAVKVVAAGQPFEYLFTGATSASTTWETSSLPEGVFFHSANRRLSGAVAVPGAYPIPVTVSAAGMESSAQLTLVVVPAAPAAPDSTRPFLTSTGHVLAYVGAPILVALDSANADATFTVGALPAGLSYDSSRRAILGTPASAGRHLVAVSAHAGSMTESATLLITIRPYETRLANVFSDLRLPAGNIAYLGQPYADPANTLSSYFPLVASTYSWSHTGLPPGLNGLATGGVEGTPTRAGEFEFTALLNPAPPLSFARILTVEPAARSAALPVHAAQAELLPGSPAHISVSASQPAELIFSGLPAGLAYSEAKRELVGQTTAPAGAYPVAVTATNAHGSVASRLDLLVRSSLAAPRFTSASTASATCFESFSYAATTVPTATAFAADHLPPGLALDPDTGRVSGRPAQAGDHVIQLTASNAAGSSTLALRVHVAAGLATEPAFTVRANSLWPLGTDRSLVLARADTTSISASSLPSGLAFGAADRLLFGRLLSVAPATASLSSAAGAARPNLVGCDPLLSPPWFVQEPGDIVVLAGRSARFLAAIDGRPAPVPAWTLNDEARTAEADGSLLIASAFPSLDGASVVLRATNSSGAITSHAATLTVRTVPVLSFAEWISSRGLPPDRRGPLDTPPSGATPNLLAYAMDLSVGENFVPAPEFIALPTPVLRLTYTRAKYADNVTLVPQRSSNLGTWETDGIVTEKLSEDAYRETWRATVPTGAPLQFLRLTATIGPAP